VFPRRENHDDGPFVKSLPVLERLARRNDSVPLRQPVQITSPPKR
jgi:hypothetical protein